MNISWEYLHQDGRDQKHSEPRNESATKRLSSIFYTDRWTELKKNNMALRFPL